MFGRDGAQVQQQTAVLDPADDRRVAGPQRGGEPFGEAHGGADPDPWAGFTTFALSYIRLRNELCDVNKRLG
ncbi:hypothetical protein, partial [Nonomuraea sp. NPDC005501]|uniref:hypothetical protein n=1 Tax=Nonomuraea sp. NPDC005501 TaxID=3156884 RepID=UPI0033B50E10